MKTLMLYLNGDFDGGTTNFVNENQTLYMVIIRLRFCVSTIVKLPMRFTDGFWPVVLELGGEVCTHTLARVKTHALADLKRGVSNFFHFHAVVGKNRAK